MARRLIFSIGQARSLWGLNRNYTPAVQVQLNKASLGIFVISAVWFVLNGLLEFRNLTGDTGDGWLDLALLVVFLFPPVIMHTVYLESHHAGAAPPRVFRALLYAMYGLVAAGRRVADLVAVPAAAEAGTDRRVDRHLDRLDVHDLERLLDRADDAAAQAHHDAGPVETAHRDDRAVRAAHRQFFPAGLPARAAVADGGSRAPGEVGAGLLHDRVGVFRGSLRVLRSGHQARPDAAAERGGGGAVLSPRRCPGSRRCRRVPRGRGCSPWRWRRWRWSCRGC